jgi:hypothetical protein
MPSGYTLAFTTHEGHAYLALVSRAEARIIRCEHLVDLGTSAVTTAAMKAAAGAWSHARSSGATSRASAGGR